MSQENEGRPLMPNEGRCADCGVIKPKKLLIRHWDEKLGTLRLLCHSCAHRYGYGAGSYQNILTGQDGKSPFSGG